MTNFKYGFKFARYNKNVKKSTHIFIIQIILAELLLAITLNYYSTAYRDYNLAKKYYGENAYYTYGTHLDSLGSDEYNAIITQLTGLKEIVGAPRIYLQESYGDIYCYEKLFLENYMPALSSGVELSKAKNSDGYINVIYMGGPTSYSVGDTAEMPVFIPESAGSVTIKLKVVGVAEDDALFINFSGEVSPHFVSMHYKTTSNETENDLFVADKSTVNDNLIYYLSSKYFIFDDNISQSDLANNYEILSAVSYKVANISEILDNTLTQINRITNALLPVTVTLMVFIVLSLAGISLLNVKENKKNYAIITLNGARISDCVKIEVFKAVYIIILPTIIYLLTSIIGGTFQPLLKLSWAAITAVSGFAAFLICISAVMAMISFKDKSIKKLLVD